MKKYKVIWFDDEFQTLNIIKEKALLSGIRLIGFNNAKDGIAELEKNVLEYDAAIVDGKFFRTANQAGDVVDDKALFEVGNYLEKLAVKKWLPWFILSGQISFTKEKNRFADGFKDNKVFDKTKDEDLQALWADLKAAADEQEDTQLRHNYARVFEVCTDKYIGEAAAKHLTQILHSIGKPTGNFDDELYFTQIRIVLESMFRAANKIGLLHDECTKGRVNLAESSLFMAGETTKHLGVACSKAHFSKLVSESVKSILFITGAASHTSDPEIKNNINLQEYRQVLATPYLLYSLTFQLMDVLIWYKQYADANPDYQANVALWQTIKLESKTGTWIKGKIGKLADNGFGTFYPMDGSKTISITPQMIAKYHLKLEQNIEVITKLDASGTKTQIHELRVRD